MPSVVAPSLKVIVPVGVPEPGAIAAMLAVNVTDWPKADGLADDETDALVEAWLTVCVMIDDELVAKLPSPAYSALMLWFPTANVAVVNVALPDPLRVPVPIAIPPS